MFEIQFATQFDYSTNTTQTRALRGGIKHKGPSLHAGPPVWRVTIVRR